MKALGRRQPVLPAVDIHFQSFRRLQIRLPWPAEDTVVPSWHTWGTVSGGWTLHVGSLGQRMPLTVWAAPPCTEAASTAPHPDPAVNGRTCCPSLHPAQCACKRFILADERGEKIPPRCSFILHFSDCESGHCLFVYLLPSTIPFLGDVWEKWAHCLFFYWSHLFLELY